MVKYVDPFVNKSRADLQMFRYADFKYIHFITRSVKEWFMQCLNVMYEPMLVERIVQIALNADVYYRRNVKSGVSRAAVRQASCVNWGRRQPLS